MRPMAHHAKFILAVSENCRTFANQNNQDGGTLAQFSLTISDTS